MHIFYIYPLYIYLSPIKTSFSTLNWLPDLPDLWFSELAKVDNTPITLALIVKGMVLMAIGYFICRTTSRAIEHRILSRLDIDLSLKHTFGTIIFYFFFSMFTLMTLSLLNIPISVFAWIGGAFALGIGLGSQNIVNNFISGLIMMAERPIKVGDIINLEGVTGVVEHIGARSTHVKSFDNTHIIVPNSSFLEKNIHNWTLSDDIVRATIKIGVAYDSPTDKVENLLKESINEENLVLRKPVPQVLFSNFGSSSLDFELIFWAHVPDILELKRLESRVRHKVNKKFIENKVTIAFPQLDVHFFNNSPTFPLKTTNT